MPSPDFRFDVSPCLRATETNPKWKIGTTPSVVANIEDPWRVASSPVLRRFLGIDHERKALSIVSPDNGTGLKLRVARVMLDSTARDIVDSLADSDSPVNTERFVERVGLNAAAIALMKMAAAGMVVWNDSTGNIALSPEGYKVSSHI